MKEDFFNLKLPEMKISDGFELDTLVLEEQMEKNNGNVSLREFEEGYYPYLDKIDDSLRKFVPYFKVYKSKEIKALANKYNISSPCSMVVKSEDELLEHMSMGYQVAHFNYILGKKHKLKDGSFPKLCCGISSIHVALSLIELGYPNAVYAYSQRHDHGYVVLPFVFENKTFKGVIVVDPTSDQLWNNKKIRNATFIKLGAKWEYKTDWRGGKNLFPDRLYSIDIMKKTPEVFDYDSYPAEACDGEFFFNKAFTNQIRIGGK